MKPDPETEKELRPKSDGRLSSDLSLSRFSYKLINPTTLSLLCSVVLGVTVAHMLHPGSTPCGEVPEWYISYIPQNARLRLRPTLLSILQQQWSS